MIYVVLDNLINIHYLLGGRLIVFGAATVLPREARSLTILDWLKMGMNMGKMPKLDTMDMVMSSKSVLGTYILEMSKIEYLFSPMLPAEI